MKLQDYKTPFLLALSLLTRIPAGLFTEITDNDSGKSALFYPLVGLIIGAIIYLPVLLFPNVPALVLAAIIVTIWAIITGGLHLDGLADSADGWLGGLGDQERTLRIMKDPVVGAAGAIALVCFLLLKFVSVTALIESDLAWLIMVAPLLGRTMILLTFKTTPYANKQGMANTVVENLPKNTSWAVLIAGAVIGLFVSFWGVLLVLIGFYFLRRLMLKRLGGCTGDTVGATVEISEMLFMLGAVLIV
ncbi:adenosylcobinamide-GDP ribazoletransferase [Cocleimonas sp. KMM 6892]|uniref:adenosylcobinamide-GDP ribazoletransferase n=1 Tax=unclassified Cocleimonas TaxID=2639732 RepID=UPI002DBF392C|nr:MULTISPECIES: adenosylcobinamide-GDP ribazoletransferase [unclassified Cocleimonas]MEB8430875.1 adenosylcobinamide-GDP ribazoletransferase [Cocleimonas sp. KMM 6892]MEC4714353.1 adenosylcobinamide-GDP ribazoletransferase [Cocleimonas sp. KMM 6895]MEC4743684.1 adenosylcobinamide-GDP ribazoletransferase [Cocleimonas sp. KMM 6896]